MIGRLLNRRAALEEAGARARREHSDWLTRALQSGARWPRIPTRRVSQGGFAEFMSRQDGPRRAERWWDAAIGRARGLDPHAGDPAAR